MKDYSPSVQINVKNFNNLTPSLVFQCLKISSSHIIFLINNQIVKTHNAVLISKSLLRIKKCNLFILT